MRITAGKYSSRHIKDPKGPVIRTTLDHVRQALFNLLGERVIGVKVLDLFSGSGALGIEALSRGASHVTFVDRSLFCIRAIEANLESLSLTTLDPAPFALVRGEAVSVIKRLARSEETFDLVIMDPPYGRGLARKSLIALGRCAIVSPAGLVVVEHDRRESLPPEVEVKGEGEGGKLNLQRLQRYGDTALTIYERQQ